jgi:hypothetical protein
MHARLSPTILVLSVPLPLLAISAPALAQPDTVVLTATLSGAHELNEKAVRNQGDPKGEGAFTGQIAPGKGQLCYTLSWSKIGKPSMAHIHSGSVGDSGPVFIPLPDLASGQHCIAVEKDKLASLIARPAAFYVNVHNAAYPSGAIRGQLEKK